MARYLLDANLPRYFSIWDSDDYVHQLDIGPRWRDTEIWQHAKDNGLTIITKDSDFSHRVMVSDPPPRVIHIRLGNMHMRQFHSIVSKCWEDVLQMSREHRLVTVWKDRLEGVR
jgi:predicted nuclease of predicted toxin-antitoxin system